MTDAILAARLLPSLGSPFSSLICLLAWRPARRFAACLGTALAGHFRPLFSAASSSNGIKMNGMLRCKISKDIAGKAVIYLID
ncbi:hypothetical protein ACFSQE_15295 [Vogesella fluminis]|uniref:hypothetical protein n=1 Tax=Vogesella fluminis TaxID=1069161 RepID=UPI003638565A